MTGEVIRRDELVKGYEFARNESAAINPQEIKAAEVETSHTIDLFHFVKGENVDPIYFERSY
jgi:DNA end-binding protein Ku